MLEWGTSAHTASAHAASAHAASADAHSLTHSLSLRLHSLGIFTAPAHSQPPHILSLRTFSASTASPHVRSPRTFAASVCSLSARARAPLGEVEDVDRVLVAR
eukprot:1340450-Prymnesium_polylepis.1